MANADQFVWAKMKGYPPWPGKICKRKPKHIKGAPKSKGPSKCIFFFGTKDYSWIEESNLKPYKENRDEYVKNIKNKQLKEAIERIDEYLLNPKKYKANAESTESPKLSSPKPSNTLKIKKEKKKPDAPYSIPPSRKLRNFASKKTFGFLGVGIMGSGVIKNLINSGHKVIIWDQDPAKSRKFVELGADVAETPYDVAEQVDIIFSCVFDSSAAKEILSNLTMFLDEKGYVEMTGLNQKSSEDICDAIVSKGGRYLEAQMLGSRVQAEDGTLVILAAGDRTIFDECQTCFKAMCKSSFFLGDVGNASNLYSIFQALTGVMLGAFAEALALAQRLGIQQKHVLEIFELSTLASPYLIQIGQAIINQDYTTNQALIHTQQDLRQTLELAEQNDQDMPITATTNEVFKFAKRNGYSHCDASSVYDGYYASPKKAEFIVNDTDDF